MLILVELLITKIDLLKKSVLLENKKDHYDKILKAALDGGLDREKAIIKAIESTYANVSRK